MLAAKLRGSAADIVGVPAVKRRLVHAGVVDFCFQLVQKVVLDGRAYHEHIREINQPQRAQLVGRGVERNDAVYRLVQGGLVG